jgi:zinc protease
MGTMGRRRWMNGGAALCFLLSAVGCATGPKVPAEPLLPEQRFAQRVFQLTSGLEILVQEDHTAPLVSIATVVRAGASDDPVGQEGLAHLVEHLSFRAVSDQLKKTGATFNATTEPERTTFFELAHKDQLEELIAIAGRRLATPLAGVSNEVLDVERDVVRNELRQRGGDPRFLAEIFRRAFPGGHPMARAPSPAALPLAAVTLASVQEFVERHYQPKKITVVVSGDVNPVEVADLVDEWEPRLLGGNVAPTGRVPPPAPQISARQLPAAPASTALTRLKLPVASRRLIVAWAAPADERGGDPFLVASFSALVLKLMTGYGQATPALIPSKSGSLFVVEVGLSAEADAADAHERLLDTLVHLRGDRVARRLMGLVKWFAGTALMRNSTDLLKSTISVAHYLSATRRPSFYRDNLEQIAAVDGLAVSDFLWDTVSRDRAVAILVEPERAGQEEAGGPTLVANAEHIKHDLGETVAVNLAGMGSPEIAAMVRPPQLAPLARFRLSNGLGVTVVPRPKGTPIAEVIVQLPVGNRDVVPFGLVELADELSAGGCTEEALLDEVGGELTTSGGDEPVQIHAQVFAGNLANAFAAVGNEVRCRELTTRALSTARTRLEARAKVNERLRSRPGVQALEAFYAALYPDRAYGMRNRDLAALQAIEERDLEAAIRAAYDPAGASAVVITDRAAAEILPLMEQHLGTWRAPAAETPLRVAKAAATRPPGRTVRVFAAKQPGQAYLRFGCRLQPATEATLPAYELLAAIVRREANQVRASWGATYGFDVEVVNEPRGIAHLVVSGAVEPARAVDAVARLLGFVGQLGSAGPDFKSFTLERWDLGREFNRRFATASGVADALLAAGQQGWSVSAWDDFPRNLAQLPRSTVKDVLAPCAGNEVVTLLGDEPALTRELGARGVLAPAPAQAQAP